MTDSMYPDSGEGEQSSDSSSSKSKSKEKDDGEDTQLVPKTFLGLKEDDTAEEGKKCTIEIVHDYGDEVEVKWVKKSDKKDKESPSEEMSADEEIDGIEAASKG